VRRFVGHRKEAAVEQHALGRFTWVELDTPTVTQLDLVREQLGLPAFAIDVALRPHHRPRLESYDGHLLLVLKPATYLDPDEVIQIGQLVLVAGPDAIVTIGPGNAARHRAIRRALERDPTRLALGPAAVVHAIADQLVDDYAAVLDGLDVDVDEIETQVFSAARGSHAERIYRLKTEVQEFRWAVGPLPSELDELLAADVTPEWAALADQFRDVRARSVRAAEHVANLDELLNSALNAHLAQIAIQQNNDMRRISAWVAIVAAPTAMAGIYGMNFRFMPELEWRYGYFMTLAVMASVCALLYRLFKRSGWL
jgi:magnesium transporter